MKKSIYTVKRRIKLIYRLHDCNYLFIDWDSLIASALELSKHVEQSLRKGKADEQCVAAICSGLVLVQLGESEEKAEVFQLCYFALKTVLANASATYTARAMVGCSYC